MKMIIYCFCEASHIWLTFRTTTGWQLTQTPTRVPTFSFISEKSFRSPKKPFWTPSFSFPLSPALSLALPLCSGLNVICCVSISLSTWAVSRWTRSLLHLVSADSSPLCLWLFGSQSALAKHVTETGKALPLGLSAAQLATLTRRELKHTFCPGGKQRGRLTHAFSHHTIPNTCMKTTRGWWSPF